MQKKKGLINNSVSRINLDFMIRLVEIKCVLIFFYQPNLNIKIMNKNNEKKEKHVYYT